MHSKMFLICVDVNSHDRNLALMRTFQASFFRRDTKKACTYFFVTDATLKFLKNSIYSLVSRRGHKKSFPIYINYAGFSFPSAILLSRKTLRNIPTCIFFSQVDCYTCKFFILLRKNQLIFSVIVHLDCKATFPHSKLNA